MAWTLAQASTNLLPSQTGSDVADRADSPEKLALVWLVGGVLITGFVVPVIKSKMDKD